MNNKSRNILAVILGIAAFGLVLAIMLNLYFYGPVKVAPAKEVNTNAVSSAEAGGVGTQSDGAVIVRDKGASFTMAPATSSQPPVVTEQEVRSRSKPQ